MMEGRGKEGTDIRKEGRNGRGRNKSKEGRGRNRYRIPPRELMKELDFETETKVQSVTNH